jgi:hypothetical protein
MKPPASRTRWAVYAIAGVATIAAVAWASRLPAPNAAGAGVAHADAARRVARRDAGHDPVTAEPGAPTGIPMRPRSAIATVTADPFAPLGGGGGGDASPLAPAKAASAPSVAIAPPASTLVYVGRWDEQGERTAILNDGGQMVFAKAGETIDGQYHVASVTDDEVVIERLPGHEQQVLSLRGMGAGSSSSTGFTPRIEGGPSSAGSADATD